jgi:DUF4097 and DUF4098 domain-containing protein YvlB
MHRFHRLSQTLALAGHMLVRPLAVTGSAIAILAVPALAEAGPVSESKTAAPDGSVRIVTVVTDIEVIGTKTKKVEVKGEIVDGAELRFTSGKHSTDIEVRPPKGRSKGKGKDQPKLTVYVPAGSSVTVKTVAGRQRMSEVTGVVSLEAVSGDITVDGAPKELEAASVSGDLFLVGSSQRTRAQSVSGKVRISGSRGKLEASSVSGKLEVEKASLSRCEISTVSGSIEFDGALLSAGPHEIKSHAGKITLTLPTGKPVEIHASSFSGTIRNKIGNTNSRSKAHVSVGKGGPRVTVRSFSGGITIQPGGK